MTRDYLEISKQWAFFLGNVKPQSWQSTLLAEKFLATSSIRNGISREMKEHYC